MSLNLNQFELMDVESLRRKLDGLPYKPDSDSASNASLTSSASIASMDSECSMYFYNSLSPSSTSSFDSELKPILKKAKSKSRLVHRNSSLLMDRLDGVRME